MKNISEEAREVARQTMGKRLHVLEFWMPQPVDQSSCNLHCQHCYVPSGGRTRSEIMTVEEYVHIMNRLMDMPAYGGKWDIIFPGMEPFLPQNLPLLMRLCRVAASKPNIRTIGVTTNATLLRGETLMQVARSPITAMNFSLDGGEAAIHDAQRGLAGLFDLTTRNIAALAKLAPHISLTSNTTITRLNYQKLKPVLSLCRDLGVMHSAFHPFEAADNADGALSLTQEQIGECVMDIHEAFLRGEGSAMIEFESSTAASFLRLWNRGIFTGMELVSDEAGFLFLRQVNGRHSFLVNLMFYPHHFIRTLRVMDDGSLSSCRRMAVHGWQGVSDLRRQSLPEILQLPATIDALAQIWQEFIDQARSTPGLIEFLDHIKSNS